ncbi:light-harvesting complex-like protein OHP1, chloroplastic isoform X2 [Hibiscus syriacus]|uniref:light-harvesting complex-like protein OHP1, chloroplastic isoform X2 n=1 Tax=Hibiscus syriacus TaxID=106335 RepID=UPI001923DDBD|nr:light-harvesting complex-like protein OHP1, chloroplastic isoform X2 [Hibiscus syriacus]
MAFGFGFGCRLKTMATSSLISSSFLLPNSLTIQRQNQQYHNTTSFRNRASFKVEVPKVGPKFKAPFQGFTRTAEIWNSRACMIGIIGVFIVELILNKGVLQMIGVDVGKGLDIPL